MKTSDGGKGSARRKKQISDHVESLRWELWQVSTDPERKEQIKKELKRLGAL